MGPAALLVLGSGLWMVAVGYWTLTDAWILFGLALFAIALIGGALFLGPPATRLVQEIDSSGRVDAEVRRRADRIFLAARIDLALLFLIVYDMTVKPTFDRPATVAAGLGLFAAAVGAVVLVERRRREPRAALGPAVAAQT